MTHALPARVVILHYHLRQGGVTRVIQNTCAALAARGTACLVVSGEPFTDPDTDYSHLLVEELGYSDSPFQNDISTVIDKIREASVATLGGAPDLWHIHNHSLGKNLTLPLLATSLSESGERVVLQIHDFSEDGRPENYRFLSEGLADNDKARLSHLLYPTSPHVHFAVLNGRDMKYMEAAGISRERLHLLPNAVHVDEFESVTVGADRDSSSPFFLYPTRGIRRKNIGEFLLWSSLYQGRARFGVTLAPKNPLAKPVYDRWTAFANEQGLDAEFSLGETEPFETLMASADAIMTTSVAEGFGLAFLEPFLLGKSLVGRRLGEIMHDFETHGVEYEHMYDRLDVPLAWIDEEKLMSRLRDALHRYYSAYGHEAESSAAAAVMRSFRRGEMIDFGRIDEVAQEEVISRVTGAASALSEITPHALWGEVSRDVLELNRSRILEEYSLERYGEKLSALYQAVADSGDHEDRSLEPDALLNQFLNPEQFNMLRT